jgi:hypothetical protein
MTNYLTVDMDYWNIGSKERAKNQMVAMLDKAYRLKVPVIAVMNHQQLLNEVNNAGLKGVRHLINVDEHSDVSGVPLNSLNCGTWVSYVKWRQFGQYTWYRNSRDFRSGNCNISSRWNENVEWEIVESVYQRNLNVVSLLTKNCVELGICLSPTFTFPFGKKLFKDLVRDYNIVYKKGRWNEWFERKVQPPRM